MPDNPPTTNPRFELLKRAIDAIEIIEDSINAMVDENSETIIRIDGHEWRIGQWRDALKIHLQVMLTKLKQA